jgi:PAS domain S-box-containing protein
MSKRTLWLIIAAVAVLVASAGYALYRVEEQQVRGEELWKLDAIAALKAEPIVEWRRRLLGDVQANATGASGRLILEADREGWTSDRLAGLRERFDERHAFYPHANVILVRPGGEVLTSRLGVPATLDEPALRLVQDCVSSGRAMLGDMVSDDTGETGEARLDAVAPVIDASHRTVAVLIHREDTRDFLVPLMRFWPLRTMSAQTMLVRREGGDAVILHSHEQQQGRGRLRRVALPDAGTLLDQAAQGQEGRFEGPDERGVAVMARFLPIPGSPWTIVAMVERGELLAGLRAYAGNTIAVVILVILLTMAAAQIVYRLGRQRVLQQMLEAERTARNQQRQFQAMIENAADIITVFMPDGTIRFISPSIRDLTGYAPEEIVGLNGLDFVHPDDRKAVVSAHQRLLEAPGSIVAGVPYRFQRKDGSYLHLESAARNLLDDPAVQGIVINARDMTTFNQMEEQRLRFEASARQQQKLESIGTLASGVAHEINNPLNIILNYGQLLLDDPARADQVREFAEQIVKESERVAGIVRSLLAFSRQDRDTRSSKAMRDIVDGTLPLIGTLMRKDRIDIRTEVPDDLPLLFCRSQQIQQVLMNLLTNARDALNERFPNGSDEKIVRISAMELGMEGSRWVRLTVEDRGIGIPADVVPRIFDPFFTTKPRDRGTGLGLSISYGIIREHGGNLWVESEPGNGTRFHVDLPTTDQASVEWQARTADVPSPHLDAGIQDQPPGTHRTQTHGVQVD